MSATDLPASVRRLIDDCLNARSTKAMNDLLPLATYISVMPLVGREPTGREVPWRENFWYRLDRDRIAEGWEDCDFGGILEQVS